MDNQLTVFEFRGKEVHAFTDHKGRDWFRGVDVCDALKIVNASTVITRVAAKYSEEYQIGHGRPAIYVSEPGLYALIFTSRSKEAKAFQEWVFEEVLPKLRRGAFIVGTPQQALELALPKYTADERAFLLLNHDLIDETYTVEEFRAVVPLASAKYVNALISRFKASAYFWKVGRKWRMSRRGLIVLAAFCRPKKAMDTALLAGAFLMFDTLPQPLKALKAANMLFVRSQQLELFAANAEA